MQIVEILTEQKKTDLQILIFNFFTLKVISQLRFNCIQHHIYTIIYYWYWKLLLCESIFYHLYLLIYWTNSVIFIKFLHGLYNISFIWTFFLLFISFYLSMDIDTASDTSDSSEDTNIICVAAHEVESFYFCHFLFFCNFFLQTKHFFLQTKNVFLENSILSPFLPHFILNSDLQIYEKGTSMSRSKSSWNEKLKTNKILLLKWNDQYTAIKIYL